MDHPNVSSEILREFLAFESDSKDKLEQLFNARETDNQEANGRRRTGHRGSIPGHRIVQCNHVDSHSRLWNDYFKPDPVYHEANDAYFIQRWNAAGVLGLSALQKITTVVRILAYGSPADSLDEHIQISESTAIASLRRFIRGVVTQLRNCPTAWQGMYTGHCHSLTIILEAVASRDLWI
ncbi:uncharacterized protein LOC119992762 [Tripterygium wilfordii]|uniref:uncharacterized protein LOC119992762 n=1 Tax=Tripterygium wilfordii TaxID=458696 RepID=UPI0018F84B9C|nr:uncharacterized protein LOC119992762 [Tripterygium wilfordii]